MKLSTDTVTKLQAQAEAARQKAVAAREESEDLARRAARLECLEDADAPKARKDSGRYAEIADRFEADAARLEKEARTAAATLARDQAKQDLQEAAARVQPLHDAVRKAAEALGAVEAAVAPVRELPDIVAIARGLSHKPYDNDEQAAVYGFRNCLSDTGSPTTGRTYFVGLQAGLVNLAAELQKLTAPAEAALARAEASLAEVRK